MERMIFDIVIGEKHYDLQAGQRFYHNNYGTAKGHCLPDYLIIQGVQCYQVEHGSEKSLGYFIKTKYENHSIYTKERLFNAKNLLPFSSLNPECEKPEWVFVN